MSDIERTTALAACRLLGDAANGRPFAHEELPHEKELLGFAKAHRIETLVSSALRAVGAPTDAYRTLHSVADIEAFHQIQKDLSFSAVLEQLQTNNVRVLPLKGAALQAVYPDGWIRTTTDADYFIPKEQLSTALAVLFDLGFTQHSAHDGEICLQKPPRTVIELHTTLGGFSKKQQQTLTRLSQTAFTVNEQYVYTLFHLYKHFLYAGAGVRLFWDIHLLSRAVNDRTGVEAWLAELDLLPFERAVHTVNGILFDGNACTDDMTEAVETVLNSGTFGTEHIYHAMKHVAHPLTRRNRVAAWMQDYGFNREAMAMRYPVLQQHGWLYPVCVIRRIVHGMRFKRTVLRQAIQSERAADPQKIRRVLKAMQIV